MKKLTAEDLIDIAAYESVREQRLADVIGLKKRRRIGVGPIVTLLFENRETVRSQIQEMMRAERLVQPEAIQAELDVYNDLVPDEGDLTATLMIEVSDPARVREVLDRFIGLDHGERVFLRFDAGMKVAAAFEAGRSREDRISAVHFVKFRLDETARAAFRSGAGKVEIVIEHPNYHAAATIDPETRRALAEDLM
jgi:hypothetical protein